MYEVSSQTSTPMAISKLPTNMFWPDFLFASAVPSCSSLHVLLFYVPFRAHILWLWPLHFQYNNQPCRICRYQSYKSYKNAAAHIRPFIPSCRYVQWLILVIYWLLGFCAPPTQPRTHVSAFLHVGFRVDFSYSVYFHFVVLTNKEVRQGPAQVVTRHSEHGVPQHSTAGMR